MPSIIMLNCKWYLHRRGCSCPTYTKWPILKRSYWRGCLLPDNANLIELTWEAIKTPINNNCIIKPVTIIEAILNMDLNSIKAMDYSGLRLSILRPSCLGPFGFKYVSLFLSISNFRSITSCKNECNEREIDKKILSVLIDKKVTLSALSFNTSL